MTLSMALSLLVDNNLVREVVILRRNGEIFCYPCILELNIIEKYNQLLEGICTIFRPKDKEIYVVFYNMFTDDIVVAFKLPSNNNILIKIQYAKLAPIVRKYILNIIGRLKEIVGA